MEPKMSGGLKDAPEVGTPAPFTPSLEEKKAPEADDITMPTTTVDERQRPAQPGTTRSVDDVQALKSKILELENQAKGGIVGPSIDNLALTRLQTLKSPGRWKHAFTNTEKSGRKT